jgi:DNA topoisomerase-1
MKKNLVIVESPAKAKTINSYLGSDFDVQASFGHVRDLPSSKIGVDTEKNFEPSYIILPKAKKNVNLLKKLAKGASEIYLATDLDREGEAIAWHVVYALGLEPNDKRLKRITFDEITKTAILQAIKSPREINMRLVDAQQARRIVDRLVGYNLSPLLWKKIYKGLSAGRVQSVAVRLVVEREREAFVPEEYWSVDAILEKEKIKFNASLVEQDGKRVGKLTIKSEKEAEQILQRLEKGKYIVESVETSQEVRNPYAPFTTSTMQQEAANVLSFSAKQTMRLAQNLYEAGLITYMRTDSVNMASVALESIRAYISKKYGANYLPASPKTYKTKTKRAQEAHEAIRPTDIGKEAGTLGALDAREAKLYDLIWRRAVSSQMREAILDIMSVKTLNSNFGFMSRGQTVSFKGWLELYPQKITVVTLPHLKKGDQADLVDLSKQQHFTEPPARYSEATLIKALEEKGIGRPSTYAPIISTIQDRGYVIKDRGRLKPEEIGKVVNDLLVENFPNIVDYGFTAEIEDELDAVAEGEIGWQKMVKEFYEPFAKELAAKSQTIEKKNMDEFLEEKCELCGKNLVLKNSRNGKFIGCTGFPDCKYTRSYISPEKQVKIDEATAQIKDRKCPDCKGELRIVSGKYGPFIGCSNYPKCKHIERIAKTPKEESKD